MEEIHRKALEGIRGVLKAVNFPERRNTEQTAICLLALMDTQRRKGLLKGKNCLRDGARIHDILEFKRKELKEPVAENSRESYRKLSLKPLYEMGIITRHHTSVNDPNTTYSLNRAFEKILLEEEISVRRGLIDRWNASHEERVEERRREALAFDIEVRISGGEVVHLSLGAHNELIKKIIEDFAPIFIEDPKPVYIGDARRKVVYQSIPLLSGLSVALNEHGQLPDVLIYSPAEKTIYVIESVISGGAISSSRRNEIDNIFSRGDFGIEYVTAVPDRKTLRRFIEDIAWNTKVWIADEPYGIIKFKKNRESLNDRRLG